ncbi:hypothetical protein [Anabaena sp. UHCC 0451]|uniref:hypothetical protein n=1 Tax=Anabaena sp. UHCC 0451 TaxID=2055235 RepID=UPI002B1F861E|nr:hypothetical protein [Anabaena sp. UHCC 0451]MEA5577607.1 hypothetical protein [Anabaena sp. UHCC 0451]
MITKQIIQEQLESLTAEELNQVYELIQNLSSAEKLVKKPSIMSKLRKISIDASEDFSVQVAISLGRDVSEG